jgi:cobyrinic acid a,c-diamide synthase
MSVPRIVIAALKGGAGKTFLTVGLVAALRARGLLPSVFKKGPDYIDAGWLGLAAGCDCYNLDSYLFDDRVVTTSFLQRAKERQIAVVEGNRGLFDGVDAEGSFSTAQLAKLLGAPVALVLDATKVTRTAAAMVIGCRALDPGVNLRAVILNRVASPRHERALRDSIEEATAVPVIGSVSKLPLTSFPQRHLGLLPLYEHPGAKEFISEAASIVERSVDLDRLTSVASAAGPLHACYESSPPKDLPLGTGLRIGVLRDSAFQFYYPENLEALARGGADLVYVSALDSAPLPDIDGLYIGGGFPETHAERLSENHVFKESLRAAVAAGLPVYAECGGLMYLSRQLRVDDCVYPMVGSLPVSAVLERKPQGHGYIKVTVVQPNPFYPVGTELTGHEFHYSYVTPVEGEQAVYTFKVLRGHGIDGAQDGLCWGSVLGTYVHVHALGAPLWAKGILNQARAFRARRCDRGGKRRIAG